MAKNTKINSIEMTSLKQTFMELVNEFLKKPNKVKEDVIALAEVLKNNFENFKRKFRLLKWAVGNTSVSVDGPSKVKVLKFKAYNEIGNTKELENVQ